MTDQEYNEALERTGEMIEKQIIKEERERCAKIAEEIATTYTDSMGFSDYKTTEQVVNEIAKAIRGQG